MEREKTVEAGSLKSVGQAGRLETQKRADLQAESESTGHNYSGNKDGK